MKLYKLYEELILEDVAISDIKRAIDNKEVVRIRYTESLDSDAVVKDGFRIIEPYVFGVIRGVNGNYGIRAFLRSGTSLTGEKDPTVVPGWRMFRTDRIQNIKPTGETFDTPRPKYNPNGDKDMTSIFVQAKF